MFVCPSPPVDLIPPGDTVVNFADAEDQLNDNELAWVSGTECHMSIWNVYTYMYMYTVL